MAFTMEDFTRQYIKEHFAQLTPEEQREALELLTPEQRREVVQAMPLAEQQEFLRSFPLETRLADLSTEEIRQLLEHRTAGKPPAKPRKPRRKKQ